MRTWLVMHRISAGIAGIMLVLMLGGGYVAWTMARQADGASAASAPLSGDLMFVDLADGQDRVRTVRLADPAGPRRDTGLRCQRVYAAADRTVCLRLAGPGPSYEVTVLDGSGAELRTIGLPGIPNRARISASGRVVSWTSFVTGDSYLIPGGFSTRTGVLDLRTGDVVESLENFSAIVDGEAVVAADRNFWGVTVADDDRTFYATLATQNQTWLVKGDLRSRTMHDIRTTAECPSLSPDGTKVAYKKRSGRFGPWELAVLDLHSGEERRIAGTVGIDDQAAWLDDGRLAYGLVPDSGGKSSIYVVPADGSGAPEVLIPDAASPSPLR